MSFASLISYPYGSTEKKPIFDITEADNGNSENSNSSVHLDVKKYDDRLETFKNWPNKEISKELLAKAGFYYKNYLDVVHCAFCGIEGYRWVAGDDPMEDHRSWNPSCSFLRTPSTSDASSMDTFGIYNEAVDEGILGSHSQDVEPQNERVEERKTPTHPDKFTLDSRLATYANWPNSNKQTPKKLAEAGFYYLGIDDRTICFHCGGGLKDWEENDDPWVEHALWFPNCAHLILSKGERYIQEVKEKTNPRSSGKKETKEEEEAAVAEIVKVEKKDENNKNLCVICYKNEIGVAFFPCGHTVSCVECSYAVKNCVMCRTPIKSERRVFLP